MSPVALMLAGLLVLPGSAVADLGGYLERSATAEFSGEQLVTCETPDGARDSLFRIAQRDGMAMAWVGDDEELLVTAGPGVTSSVSGEDGEDPFSPVSVSDEAYETVDSVPVTFLGRSGVEVSVERDGVERIRLIVDSATGAVLRTRTFSGDGALYCDRRLISFAPGNGGTPDVADLSGPDVERLDDPLASLPAELAGLTLQDSYSIEGGTLSYYSDGFFSLGVVLSDRSFGFPEGNDVVTVPAGRGEYQRSYEAGRVTVAWTSLTGSLALVGDTPPDLTEEALGQLPQPVNPGFFERIWTRFFG